MSSYFPDPKGVSASEDVNDFLQRIKQLGESRVTEDLERSKKLEEDIAQSKKERQARRAERARSISPAKSSPANTPPPLKSAARRSPESSPRTIAPSSATTFISSLEASKKVEAPVTTSSGLKPSPDFIARKNPVDEAMDRLNGSNYDSGDGTVDESPMKENAPPLNRSTNASDTFDNLPKQNTPVRASPSSAIPSRNSPLSWQRRPTSQASDRPKSRPLSQFATENAARSPLATPDRGSTPVDEDTLSRNQIAQSLASKDPTWFRQTADRGVTSAAYRRNQVEDDNVSDMSSSVGRAQLPGMSGRPEAAGRTSPPSSGMGSPIPLTAAQRLDPPSETISTNEDSQGSFGKSTAMSPSQGRISPERVDRPISPTKGMGGFVQSAMMKRTDSVNKRWSVQSPPNLSRSNSIAPSSNRNSMYDVSAALTSPSARPTSSSRESPARSPSRPTSSQNPIPTTQEIDHPVRISTPVREQGASTSRPSSPSRASDSRRWSPTKSSWLESALNKPDSPKPKPTPPPSQPSWMADLQKAKQNGGSDTARPPTSGHKHQVSIGGLMRSPPPGGHTRPLSISGLPPGFTPGAVSKGPNGSIGSQDVDNKVVTPKLESKSPPPVTTKPSFKKESEATPSKASPAEDLDQSPTASKPKPDTPPKKDIGTFKARQQTPNTQKEEPEFKNVFGKLKSTKIQNYVAPDELKGNILRGKAGLAITGGPKKTERKDEFKEAILHKKEEFKVVQSEGKGVTRASRSDSVADQPVPEAIARRRTLSRANNVLPSLESVQKENSPQVPEALLKQRNIHEAPKPSTPKETVAPSLTQGKETPAGKLAGRFNPALAGLLARGPPSVASETSRATSSSSTNRTVSQSTSTTNPEVPAAGPQLTHMTKARARGPRRKAPTSIKPAAESPKEVAVAPVTRQPSKPEPKEDLIQNEVSKVELKPQPKPEPKVVEPVQKRFIKDEPVPLKLETVAKPTSPPIDTTSQPASTRKLDIKSRMQFLAQAQEKSAPKPDLEPPRSPAKKLDFAELLAKRQNGATEVKQPFIIQKPVAPIKSPLLTQGAGDATANLKSFKSPESSIKSSPVAPVKPQGSVSSTDASDPVKSPDMASPKIASPVVAVKPQGSVTSRDSSSSIRSPDLTSPKAASPAIPMKPQGSLTSRDSSSSIKSPDVASLKIASPAIPVKPQSSVASTNGSGSIKSPDVASPKAASPGVPVKRQGSVASRDSSSSIRSPAAASPKIASPVVPVKPQPSPKAERIIPAVVAKPQATPVEIQPSVTTSITAAPMKSVKGAAAMWNRPSATETMPPPPRVKSPIKLPTQADEQSAMENAGLRSASREKKDGIATGLGLGSIANNQSTVFEAKPLPSSDARGRGAPSPSHSLRSTPSIRQLSNDRYLRKQMDSPSLQATETTELITNFFGQQFGAPSSINIDTASILASNPNETTKVRTLNAQMYHFFPDGKKHAVASHLDRMLFEKDMYLCVHNFEISGVKKSPEVYLWSGNDVDESTVRSAESFAQREARNIRGKLIAIKQGRETSEFLQALGGAVVTRRGLSKKHDSLAPHILCGRRHMGEIVFDEVDFAPTSLCSGFPYLIATQSAKTYLWIGKGSNIDEISCAKLIGMEFGLTGEIEEVHDGKEPESFLKEFGDAKMRNSADHWRLKASYDKYRGRLFRIESSKVHEISPFTQSDISPSSIYVLDAFFEMYIIVGARSQSEFAAFRTALHFAQEYGMEAALREDRPFVPISTVVLEGVPRDMKSVFRQWRDNHVTTLMRSPSVASISAPSSPSRIGLKRTRSLRVVPLMAALEATRVPVSSDYNYDEEAQFFPFFVLTLSGIIAIPLTYTLLKPSSDPGATAPRIQTDYKPEHADLIAHQKKKQKRRERKIKRIILAIVLWVLMGLMAYLIHVTARATPKIWNPYDILQVSESATERQIKSHYKKMSLQFHPDKVRPDPAKNETLEMLNDRFVEITKAYKALTDEEVRNNFIQFGHPDGKQGFSIGIALPKFMVSNGNGWYVVAGYTLLLGILLPYIVGTWWYGTQRLSKEKVLLESANNLFREYDENITQGGIISALSVGSEYKTMLKGDKAESGLSKIESRILREVEGLGYAGGLSATEKTKLEDLDGSRRKALALLWAYLGRVDLEDATLNEAKYEAAPIAHALNNSFTAITLAFGATTPILSSFATTQNLIQAMPPKASPLLQLPYFTPAIAKAVEGDAKTHLTLQKYMNLPESYRKSRTVGKDLLTEGQYNTALKIARQIPYFEVAKAFFKVTGEKFITPGSLVSLVVKGRFVPPGSLSVPEINELDLEDVDPDEGDLDAILGRKSKSTKDSPAESDKPHQPPLAYAPYYARDYSPRWHVFLTDSKQGKIAVPPFMFTVFDKPIFDADGKPTFNMQTMKAQFQAPPQAGQYTFVCHVVCDSYVGLDTKMEVTLTVDDAAKAVEIEEEEEISEPDEDSLAGQMQFMKTGQAPPPSKKKKSQESSDDESDTEGEEANDTSDTNTDTDEE